jgi:hypothetical protein
LIAPFLPLIFHRAGGAENGFLKFQVEIGAQVHAALRPRAAASTASSEEIAEAEKVAEDIAEITEDHVGIEAEPTTRSAHAGVSEAVVLGALLRISQH